MNNKLYVLKFGDVIPAVIVILMFFVPLYSGINKNFPASKAEVVINNIKTFNIDLSKEAVYDTGHMKIKVTGGKIRVVDADCQGRFCVNTGFISQSGSVIVCAPNKTVIKIENSKAVEYDAVSY